MRFSRPTAAAFSVAIAIWAVTSCGGGSADTTTTPLTHGSISGKVVDSDSSSGGVAGVSLQLTSPAGVAQTVTTSASGQFSLGNLDPGAWTVQLNTPTNFLLATGETGQRSAAVVAGSTATVVTDFQLARTKGSVAGSVKNGSAGVPAATLGLARAGFTTKPITADASGNFTLTSVPTGNWTLSVSVPATLQLATGEVGTRAVVIAANQTTQVSAFAMATKTVSTDVEIQVSGSSFTPSNITIAAGTTVRWTNDGATHTITPQNPAQQGVFERVQFSANGVVMTHVFNVPGQVYRYRCEFHSENFTSGMVGTITVQ